MYFFKKGLLGVAILVIILALFSYHNFSPIKIQEKAFAPLLYNISNSSLKYFQGNVGELANGSIMYELSHLQSQFQQVGQTLANNGTIKCQPAGTSANGPYPEFCYILSSQLGVYSLIPIPVNTSLTPLMQNGKPLIVFIGAQGCPFCALQRWAMIIALEQFGNFSKLFLDRSATIDGNIPTFTFNFSQQLFNEYVVNKPPYKGEAPYGDVYPTPFFVGAFYSSPYVSFLPFDEIGGSFLTNVSGINDLDPYVFQNVLVASGVLNQSSKAFGIYNFIFGGVPFFDLGNKYVFDGAIVDTNLITPIINGSRSQFLQSLEDPTPTSFGAAELAAANVLTAQICKLINNAAQVCQLPYMQTLQKKILSAYSLPVSSSFNSSIITFWIPIIIGILVIAFLIYFAVVRLLSKRSKNASEIDKQLELERLKKENLEREIELAKLRKEQENKEEKKETKEKKDNK